MMPVITVPSVKGLWEEKKQIVSKNDFIKITKDHSFEIEEDTSLQADNLYVLYGEAVFDDE